MRLLAPPRLGHGDAHLGMELAAHGALGQAAQVGQRVGDGPQRHAPGQLVEQRLGVVAGTGQGAAGGRLLRRREAAREDERYGFCSSGS